MKSAIIVGCEGQDGKIAYDFLSKQNYKLIGIDANRIRHKEISWSKPVDISNNACWKSKKINGCHRMETNG